MMGRTHLVGGFLSSALALNHFQMITELRNVEFLLFAGTSIIGSLIADVDHKKSTIGKSMPWFSNFLQKTVGHRTLTHSIISVLFLVFVTFIVQRLENEAIFIMLFGLTVGHISHIVLDCLTHNGVSLLYPISKKRYKLPLTIRTGSYAEKVLTCAMIIYTVSLLVQ